MNVWEIHLFFLQIGEQVQVTMKLDMIPKQTKNDGQEAMCGLLDLARGKQCELPMLPGINEPEPRAVHEPDHCEDQVRAERPNMIINKAWSCGTRYDNNQGTIETVPGGDINYPR